MLASNVIVTTLYAVLACLFVAAAPATVQAGVIGHLDGDLDAAEQALQLAATIPCTEWQDESPLDFNERMGHLRIARDLDAAEQAVIVGATLPCCPFADESRLDFNGPLEAVRIAIARGRFAEALTFAHEAAQDTDARICEGRPTHAPIGVLARAELRFPRGIALTGVNQEDSEALRLIQSAIDIVEESAASRPPGNREPFFSRFGYWRDVYESAAS